MYDWDPDEFKEEEKKPTPKPKNKTVRDRDPDYFGVGYKLQILKESGFSTESAR